MRRTNIGFILIFIGLLIILIANLSRVLRKVSEKEKEYKTIRICLLCNQAQEDQSLK